MATERFGLIQSGGKDATVVGDDVQVGQTAPDFNAHALDWSVVRGIDDTKGKVRILAAVPSFDTDTCDRETRRSALCPETLVRRSRRRPGDGAV